MMRVPLLFLLALPLTAVAAEVTPGPVPASVVSVYDRDTLTVKAEPWPGIIVDTCVRVNGIDTPEIRGKCQEEKYLANQARNRVRELVGERVELRNIRLGKFAGRVVADVWRGETRIADVLIEEGLGHEYPGGTREGWGNG